MTHPKSSAAMLSYADQNAKGLLLQEPFTLLVSCAVFQFL